MRIAVKTGEREVVFNRLAAVLYGDDVFYVVTIEKLVVLMNAAVLTPVACAVNHGSTKIRLHRSNASRR